MRVQLEMTWRYNCNVSGSCDQCSIGRGTMWSTNIENVPWCKMEIGVQCSAVLPLLLSIFLMLHSQQCTASCMLSYFHPCHSTFTSLLSHYLFNICSMISTHCSSLIIT